MPSFSLSDRFNFFMACIGFGDTFEKAFNKSQLTLSEAIVVHDTILPEQKQVKDISIDGKKYRYVGNGQFKRIDSKGRYYTQVNRVGTKKIGFIKNPLEFVFTK